MFDKSLEYKLVQIRKIRFPKVESFIQEYIYRFYSHNAKGRLKYIVSIKTYKNGLLTLDFYPKINLTPRINSLDNVRDLRYMMLTRQNAFGPIGATILDIMVEVGKRVENSSWGFLAANLPNETVNTNNKRFKIYTEVLRRTFMHHFDVYVNKQNSVIFVIHKAKAAEKQNIIDQYEQIFSEIN